MGLPERLGHSPLSNLSMGSATSHSCGNREKPVPQHASTAMMDYFPQNITQINPFSTLSGFLRNPVSNEEGKWYKATHFSMQTSNCSMKVDLLPQPPKSMGPQRICLLLAKTIMTLSYFLSCMCMLCVCVCVCARAVVAINPRLHSSHLLFLYFQLCVHVCVFICMSVYSDRDKPRALCMYSTHATTKLHL